MKNVIIEHLNGLAEQGFYPVLTGTGDNKGLAYPIKEVLEKKKDTADLTKIKHKDYCDIYLEVIKGNNFLNINGNLGVYAGIDFSILDIDAIYEGTLVTEEQRKTKENIIKDVDKVFLTENNIFKALYENGLIFDSSGGKGWHIPVPRTIEKKPRHVFFYDNKTFVCDIQGVSSIGNMPAYVRLGVNFLSFLKEYSKHKDTLSLFTTDDFLAVITKGFEQKTTMEQIKYDESKMEFTEKIILLYSKALHEKNEKIPIHVYFNIVDYTKTFIDNKKQEYVNTALKFFSWLPNYKQDIAITQINATRKNQISKDYNVTSHTEYMVKEIRKYVKNLDVFQEDFLKTVEKNIEEAQRNINQTYLDSVDALLGVKKSTADELQRKDIEEINARLKMLEDKAKNILNKYNFSPVFRDLIKFISKHGLKEEIMQSEATAFFAAISVLCYLQQMFLFDTGKYSIRTNVYYIYFAPSSAGKQTLSDAISCFVEIAEELGFISTYETISSKVAFLEECMLHSKRNMLFSSDEAGLKEEVKTLLFSSNGTNESKNSQLNGIKDLFLNLFNSSKTGKYKSKSAGEKMGMSGVAHSTKLFAQYKLIEGELDMATGSFNRFIPINAVNRLTVDDLKDSDISDIRHIQSAEKMESFFKNLDFNADIDESKLTTTDELETEAKKLFIDIANIIYVDYAGYGKNNDSLICSNALIEEKALKQKNMYEFKQDYLHHDLSDLSEKEINKLQEKKVSYELFTSYYEDQKYDYPKIPLKELSKTKLKAFFNHLIKSYGGYKTNDCSNASNRVLFYSNKMFCAFYNGFITFKDNDEQGDFIADLCNLLYYNQDTFMAIVTTKKRLQGTIPKYTKEKNQSYDAIVNYCNLQKKRGVAYMLIKEFEQGAKLKNYLGSVYKAKDRDELIEMLKEEGCVEGVIFDSENSKSNRPLVKIKF